MSRRAPGRHLGRTHFSAAQRASAASNDDGAREVWRSQTRMQGRVFGFLFTGLACQRLEKGLAGWAKPVAPTKPGNQLGSVLLATLNADMAFLRATCVSDRSFHIDAQARRFPGTSGFLPPPAWGSSSSTRPTQNRAYFKVKRWARTVGAAANPPLGRPGRDDGEVLRKGLAGASPHAWRVEAHGFRPGRPTRRRARRS